MTAVSGNPAALVNCNVHGNEPSSREACLIMARELAFADDPRTLDLLSNMTVLIVPAINGDGRAANTRGNSTGQDLNRDHSLLRQPETFALLEQRRRPDASEPGHSGEQSAAQDLLGALHLQPVPRLLPAAAARDRAGDRGFAGLQRNNTDQIVFRGSYDVPAFPAPRPGEAPPPEEPPEGILDPPPCGEAVEPMVAGQRVPC